MHAKNWHECMWDTKVEFDVVDLYKLVVPLIIDVMLWKNQFECWNCFYIHNGSSAISIIVDKKKQENVDYICGFFGYKFSRYAEITNTKYLEKNPNFVCLEYTFNGIPRRGL